MGSTSPRLIEERHALLQRVLWSPAFEKSTRIRDFILFVCERAAEEPPAEIHEQEIGHRVFGRVRDYDTSQDNIVRVTASQARKKLERYFATEGAWEPIILEIPKGQYTPIFRERSATAVESAASAEPAAQRPSSRRAVVILAACALVLAVVAIWSAARGRNPRSELESNPELNALWSQLLPAGGRTFIVLSDSSLSLFNELLDRQLTLAEFLQPEQWMRTPAVAANPALHDFAEQAIKRHFTSLANVTFAYRVAQLVAGKQSHISLSSARDFNIRQMKSDNVILLGSSRANPWVELIQDRLNFRFGFDNATRHSYFENRDPRPGEAKRYSTDSSSSYCQIAFIPNLGRTGNILTISGTEVEGTEGGGEFVTSERSMAQIRQFAHADRSGRLPYFEALLKSSRVGGAAAGFSIVALRIPKT